MTRSIKTISFAKDQPAEILSDERSVRLVRLDFYHDTYGGTHEYLAQLGEGLVKIIHMSDDAKPKISHINPEHMTRLAHAWLQFQVDCKAAEDAEKAEFQAEIDLVKARAAAIGAQMTDYAPESNYGTFNLRWTDTHPLERFNRHWQWGSTNLSLSDVQDRLKHVEEHMEIVQTDAVENPRHISTFVLQMDRAGAVEAYLFKDGPDYYELSFREHHPFHGFWIQDHLLTAGQVEYRLNYVEGVLKQATTK